MSGDQDTGASILVVEDDEQIAELMRDFLEAEGFQVRHAADGRETTTQLEHGRPDLVLLDVCVEHPRQVFGRDQLFELVWGSFGDRSAVAVYIGRLRQKIEPDPSSPRYVVTVWGAGYRLDSGSR